MTNERNPHPDNVDGPFYVVDGCCTSCGVPETAPDTFGFASDGHCFVRRQPVNEDELHRMLRVVRTQELGCIRYRGNDSAVLRRLAEADEATQCDVRLDPTVVPVLRRFVFFTVEGRGTAIINVVLSGIREALLQTLGANAVATDVGTKVVGATFSIAWFQHDYHAVELREHGDGLLAHHNGPLGLSEMLDDVVRASGYRDVQWWSSASGESPAPRPW